MGNIPKLQNNVFRFGLVIGNENYQTYADKYTNDVRHAIYDSEKFSHLLKKNLLVSENTLSTYFDATNTNIKLILNKIEKTTKKLNFKTELVFYFNGKVARSDNGELYLIPVDATEKDLFFAMPVNDLFERIRLAGIDEAWVFVDAVESGKIKGPGLLESAGQEVSVPKEYDKFIHFRIAEEQKESTQTGLVTKQGAEDNTPPKLSEIVAEIDIESPDSYYKLKGKATDVSGISLVAVNGEETHLDADGSFFANVVLSQGKNDILVEAIDNYDNMTSTIVSINFTLKPEEETVQSIPKFYAILIGVNNYSASNIPDLAGPIKDMETLAGVLNEGYNFKSEYTWVLKDATSKTIWDTLNYLSRIIKPEDNLIFAFAGHGTWDESTGIGYWLASDANASGTDNWLSNSMVTSRLSGLNTKHTLVIADACFGGGIFRVRGLPSDANLDILKKYEFRSRNAITSGDLNEVPDKSAFIYYMVSTMRNNTEKYITAEQLYYKIKIPVMEATDNIPQYGKIKSSGDEGGDFVFVKKIPE